MVGCFYSGPFFMRYLGGKWVALVDDRNKNTLTPVHGKGNSKFILN